jgi:hypothetical protein
MPATNFMKAVLVEEPDDPLILELLEAIGDKKFQILKTCNKRIL